MEGHRLARASEIFSFRTCPASRSLSFLEFESAHAAMN